MEDDEETGPESARFLADDVHEDEAHARLRLASASLADFALIGCAFTACDLQKAVFDGARIEDTTFEGCDLALASFAGTLLQDVVFRSCKLSGVDLTRLSASLIGAPLHFEDCMLRDAVLVDGTFARSTFVRCDFSGADFAGADLQTSDLTGSVLTDARFERTDLTGANLSGATGYRISPTNNRVKGLKVSLPDAVGLVLPFGVEIVDPPIAEPGPR